MKTTKGVKEMNSWIEDDSSVIDAIESAKVRYEMLTDYQSAPPADRFGVSDIAALEAISADINGHESTSHATAWSRAAWECDHEACTKALALARAGRKVFVAQDEDGYYFATELGEKK